MIEDPPLDAYPRPNVAVDLAILTVRDPLTRPTLSVLVQERAVAPVGRALPGGFVRERRTVAQTVGDVLRQKVGIEPDAAIHPVLLRLFDDPDRDDRGWVFSAGHSVSLPEGSLLSARGELVPITDDGRLAAGGPLLFDHDKIVRDAVARLRERYEIRYADDAHPDPDGFLPEPFTLHQLRMLHQAVLGGDELHKDNFNKRMKPLLEPLVDDAGKPVLSSNLRGRPAALYRKRPGATGV